MKQWSDEQLFDVLREGDKGALSVLFLRHYDTLLHYGMRIKHNRSLAEECIQELFIYFYESSARLGRVNQVKAYLFKSLRRRILEKIKQEKRLETGSARSFHRAEIEFSSEDTRSENEQNEHSHSVLIEALNTLPWRQREAVYLRYYNRLSTNEIAEIMSAANQTVLNTLYQALKNLRKDDQIRHLIGCSAPCLLFLFN